jgi:hypothetical protein
VGYLRNQRRNGRFWRSLVQKRYLAAREQSVTFRLRFEGSGFRGALLAPFQTSTCMEESIYDMD